MNGQLSERPLAEVIREISAKSLSGRLSVEQDRIKVAAYFFKGHFVFAASNLRDLRLRGYLIKTGVLSMSQLAGIAENLSDVDLAKSLAKENLLTSAAIEQAQTRQIADILRFALLMPQGSWAFDERSLLDETVSLTVDIDALLLEAERRTAPKPVEEPPPTPAPAPSESVEDFLDRFRRAETYYDLL